MTKTAELLAVYRRLAFLHDEVNRLKARGNSWKRKCEEAMKGLESTQRLLKDERLDHEDERSEKNETIYQLANRIFAYDRAVDPILDLIGAVLDEQDHLDHFHELFAIAEPVTEPERPTPGLGPIMDIEEGTDATPARCLSCNEPKEGFYLCDPCFDIALDHGGDVFDELQDAWDAGARDFPRPGKNVKELYT